MMILWLNKTAYDSVLGLCTGPGPVWVCGCVGMWVCGCVCDAGSAGRECRRLGLYTS